MKIAVLSDIHGNLPALEATLEDLDRWGPDLVVVNGDLVNRGPNSLACLELLIAAYPAARLLRGNHEEFVLACAAGDDDPQRHDFDLRRFTHWTYAQLGEAAGQLAAWDDHLDMTDLEGGTLHITHASRQGNRDGISLRTLDSELPAKLGEYRDLFVTSHTHRPFVRRFGGTLLVNTGSVGSPFDDDARASYGRFTFDGINWQGELARVAFDKARAEADFAASGLLDEGGPMTRLMLEELRQARMFVGPWMRRYHEAVLAGEITVERAVREFLDAAV